MFEVLKTVFIVGLRRLHYGFQLHIAWNTAVFSLHLYRPRPTTVHITEQRFSVTAVMKTQQYDLNVFTCLS